MVKYQANPVLVDALKIIKADRSPLDKGAYVLTLEDGTLFSATPEMTARMEPVPGDYVVTQADGYVYLNPKEVFERKYRPNEFFQYLQPADKPVVEGFPEVVFAKYQPEYIPLRTLKSSDHEGRVMSRWGLTSEQRRAVADGADVFLILMTFNQPLQPILVAVGDAPDAECLGHFIVPVPVVTESKTPVTDKVEARIKELEREERRKMEEGIKKIMAGESV